MTECGEFCFGEYGKVFDWTEETMVVGMGIFLVGKLSFS